MGQDVVIDVFDPSTADESALEGYYQVVVAAQEIDRPDEQRLTYDNLMGRLRVPFPGFGPVVHWTARTADDTVGVATVYFPEEENSHIGITEITVHPLYRRRNIGTAVLRAVLGELSVRCRRVIEGWQVTKGGAGDHWASALGFRTVNESVLQVLVVPDTDPALWEVTAPDGYVLRHWTGAAPDDLVASFAAARGAMEDAPFGDIGYRTATWTAERVRAAEEDLRSRSVGLSVAVAVREDTGEVAGFTEVELHPHRPHWVYQRDTAVVPAHRGQGLGRAVKAHLLRRLLVGKPDLERFYTSTSGSNAHMIRVNHQLGYTTVRSMIAVNHEVTALEEALAGGKPAVE